MCIIDPTRSAKVKAELVGYGLVWFGLSTSDSKKVALNVRGEKTKRSSSLGPLTYKEDHFASELLGNPFVKFGLILALKLGQNYRTGIWHLCGPISCPKWVFYCRVLS